MTASSSVPHPRRTRWSATMTAQACSPFRSAQSAADCRESHHLSSPAVANISSPRVCGRCGGSAIFRTDSGTQEQGVDMATSQGSSQRWDALDFGPPPSDLTEPGEPVLVEYIVDGRVALITLNRPPDNAINTDMGAQLTQ